jgi:hypothetical protein
VNGTGGPGGPGTEAGPGSLPEEMAALFEAIQGWVSERATGLGGRIATGSSECQLCPVCQLIGLFRAAQPAVAEHLADAGASLFAAFRAAMEAHEKQWASTGPAGHGSGVEHIDIAD